MYMGSAKISVKRRINIATFANLSKPFLPHDAALFSFCRAGHIKLIESIKPPDLILHNFLITRQVE